MTWGLFLWEEGFGGVSDRVFVEGFLGGVSDLSGEGEAFEGELDLFDEDATFGGVSDLFLAEEFTMGEPELFLAEGPLGTFCNTGDWCVEVVDTSTGIHVTSRSSKLLAQCTTAPM